jgi:putative membrane protein
VGKQLAMFLRRCAPHSHDLRQYFPRFRRHGSGFSAADGTSHAAGISAPDEVRPAAGWRPGNGRSETGTLSNIPYCGTPPIPGTLIERWNGDPILILLLAAIAGLHLLRAPENRASAAAGWAVAALALVSPLCALSVSLFAARVGQHMLLILVAAPLIARALPRGRSSPWWSAAVFTLVLWFWHMPAPYDATFRSVAAYWAMHVSLFGSAVWLWRDLLRHRPESGLAALAAGSFASMAMGLLGAVLTLASHPLFLLHLATAPAWGLSAIEDQQLGGIIMWVPGGLLFLWAVLRSMVLLWHRLEELDAGSAPPPLAFGERSPSPANAGAE